MLAYTNKKNKRFRISSLALLLWSNRSKALAKTGNLVKLPPCSIQSSSALAKGSKARLFGLWNHDCCYCCYGYLCLKSEPRKHLGPPDDGISTLFAQVFSAVIPCVQKPNHARIIYVSVKRKSEFLAVAGRQLQFSAAPI